MWLPYRMDVCPLFETLGELEQLRRVMKQLMSIDLAVALSRITKW
ncbi:hypothetical protein OK016_07625 [Vibrio chagasii]|nr:hypothetical protein [Vibrio chagasii]